MGVIYYILRYLSFPGALFRAFTEQFTLRIYEIPTEYARYMQKNELCGHIEHLLAPKKGSFGFCFIPHIITLLFGLAFLIPSGMNLFYLGKFNLSSLILLYFGFSFITNCFPLTEDAVNMYEKLYGKDSGSSTAVKVLLFLPAAVLYAGAYLERYCLSFVTGALFAYGLPFLIAALMS